MAEGYKIGVDAEIQVMKLLNSLVDSYDGSYGIGSMTTSPYDTSWVACVVREVGNCKQYLFPECFRYLLQTQLSTGGWSCSGSRPQSSEVDEILSTLAATYALCQLEARPYQLRELAKQNNIRIRVDKAVERLRSLLNKWNVENSSEVGFEVLIPSLLDLIGERGISFEFPAKERLFEIRSLKLSKIPPEYLYKKAPSTLLHSLEAFYGDPGFDYDRLTHHKVMGSFMCSPSATAAYLMRCSEWDHDAEAYLRLVVEVGAGKGLGGIPSAFPSTHFELTWVFSTVLEAGLGKDLAKSQTGQTLCSILQEAARENKGLVGFAPGIEPDVDDTAKASITLSLLGQKGFVDSMLSNFATDSGYMKTFNGERQASFSANCNALYAVLLELPESITSVKVEKIASFICDSWWAADNMPEDKWNISPFYLAMLTAQSLIKLLERWEEGALPDFSETFLHDNILLTLFQCLVRILLSQKDDGSWGRIGPCEETAYAVLALTSLASLPLARFISQQLNEAITRGSNFLMASQSDAVPEPLWIEKTMYGSSNLSQAYIYAAIFKSQRPQEVFLGGNTTALCEVDCTQMTKFVKLMEKLPSVSCYPQWLIVASWIEGRLFLPRLRRLRDTVFAREGMTEDKYFSWIPFIWTTSNNLEAKSISSQFMFDMMTLSFLNYQADEFMEAVVGVKLGDKLQDVRNTIEDIFRTTQKQGSVQNGTHYNDIKHEKGGVYMNGHEQVNAESNSDVPQLEDVDLDHITYNLKRFVAHVLHHPQISETSANDRRHLISELRKFLLAHVDQIEDNQKLVAAAQTNVSINSNTEHSNGSAATSVANSSIIYRGPENMSFKEWVRTTSSNHTSCPYSFVFACSLRAKKQKDYFKSVSAKYIADDMCHTLATLCRMYNDLGSVARDRKEGNLNSVNFAELHEGGRQIPAKDEELKARLYQLAEYERKRMNVAMAELEKIVEPEVTSMIKVFVGVTDLFGQIYVVKDIASQRTS